MLAAGNAVLVKASEVAPLTVLAFSELAKEAGVPDGMLHILPGRGEEICTHLLNDPRQRVRKVDLTGGTKAGYALGALTGRNLIPYTAELGGKAPILVAEDADLRSAVIGAAFAAFIASGQTCVTGSRAIVHEGIFRPFVDALVAKARSITEQIGDRKCVFMAKYLLTLLSSVGSARQPWKPHFQGTHEQSSQHR